MNEEILKNCCLCPRKCGCNRYLEFGYCHLKNELKIAKATLTYFEEPCISNEKGSGTIFFSGCNLGCIFCQNNIISKKNFGKTITYQRLADIMINLQEQGAININLVTPTPHLIEIKKAILLAKEKGLNIPIIYNTSGYELVESLKELEGLIDIYLPDFKYFDDAYAIKYSNAPNYFKITSLAIAEMYRQVGDVEFDKYGNLKKGVLIRHLMLPTLKEDTKNIITYIYKTYHDSIYISIMNQYTVIDKFKYPELNKTIKDNEYNEIIDFALELGIKNAYCQLDNTCQKIYIPNFDLEGV